VPAKVQKKSKIALKSQILLFREDFGLILGMASRKSPQKVQIAMHRYGEK